MCQPGALRKECCQKLHWIYIQGPWDAAVNDKGNSPQIFVANVEDRTVSRIHPKIRVQNIDVKDMTQVASRYAHRPDAAAFFVGPTGPAYNRKRDTLSTFCQPASPFGIGDRPFGRRVWSFRKGMFVVRSKSGRNEGCRAAFLGCIQ